MIDDVPIADVAVLTDRGKEQHVVNVSISRAASPITAVFASINGVMEYEDSYRNAQSGVVNFRFAVSFRPYGNELSITVKYASGDSWTHSVHPYTQQTNTEIVKQWSMLIAGPGKRSQHAVDELSRRLRTIAGMSVVELNNSAVTGSDVLAAIYGTAQKMRANDHLLVFYSGLVDDSGDHCLLDRDAIPPQPRTCLSLDNLTRTLSRLTNSRISILFDLERSISSSKEIVTPNPPAGDDERASPAAAWTDSINYHPHLELLLGTQDIPGGSAPSESNLTIFASDILSWWDDRTGGEQTSACRSEADLFTYMKAKEPHQNTVGSSWAPLYLATMSTSESTCLTPTALPRIALRIDHVDDYSGTFEAIAMSALNTGETVVSVNGVPVRRFLPGAAITLGNSLKFTVPLNAGLNWVSLSARDTKTTIGEGNIIAVGGKRQNILFQRARVLNTPRITMEQPLDSTVVTQQDHLSLIATLHDHGSRQSLYQIVNNGVIIYEGTINRTRLTDSRQKTVSVPLQPGVNKISIRFYGNHSDTAHEILAISTPTHPVTAVLIAADHNAPSGAPPLRYAVADLQLMKEMLLRYTDAAPADIIALVNDQATKGNIESTLASLKERLAAQQSTLGTTASLAKATLVLYFSGYGVAPGGNVGGTDRSSVSDKRCLATYDLDLSGISKSCLLLRDLLHVAASGGWQNTIVVLDTSFAGPSGVSEATLGQTHEYLSKTLSAVSATSVGGTPIVASNEGIVFASQPTESALESTEVKHGLFTFAMDRALEDIQPTGAIPRTVISLSDIVESANQYMGGIAHQEQASVYEGDVTLPQLFKKVDIRDLRREWNNSFSQMARDLYSMRAMDRDSLTYAEQTISKAEGLDPSWLSVRMGRARALRYEGLRCGTVTDCPSLDKADSILSEEEQRFLRREVDPRGDHDTIYEEYSLYALRAAIEKQRGNFDKALADTLKAKATGVGPVKSEFSLAELNLIIGNLQEAEMHFDNILEGNRSHSAAFEGMLTPTDWARVIVWRAVLLHVSRHRAQARGLLRAYARRETVQYRDVIRPFVLLSGHMMSGIKEREDQGLVTSSDPWMVLVANYLLRHSNEQELKEYGHTQERGDPLLFECESDLYMGIRDAELGYTKLASVLFQEAINTGRTELTEYWMAKLFLKNPAVLRP